MVEITSLEKLLEDGTDNALLRFTLGSAFLSHNKHDEALLHLGKAVELEPGYSAAWKAYGRALELKGETDKAIAIYQHGISVAEAKGDMQAVREMRVFLKRLTGNG